MSKREFFAANLRRQVDAYGGVSKAARDADVNRTQFHRYLTGQALPRPGVIAALAKMFQVPETALFAPPYINPAKVSAVDLTQHPLVQAAFADTTASSGFLLPEGRYLTYFHVPADDDVVVRAMTFISTFGTQRVFLRLTGVGEPIGSRWRFSRGRNAGLVMESRGNHFLLAVERGSARGPSLLVVRMAQTGRLLLAGQGIITARNGPAVAAVVMEKVSDAHSMADLMRMCSTIGLRDRTLDANVRILLQEQFRD
jgi:hypothetical protein